MKNKNKQESNTKRAPLSKDDADWVREEFDALERDHLRTMKRFRELGDELDKIRFPEVVHEKTDVHKR